MESEIDVHVDWSRSGLTEEEAQYGATVAFYPQDGGEPKIVLMGNREYEKVRLPEGCYDVVVLNRSFDDFGSLVFKGDNARELEAHAKHVETRQDKATRTVTRVIISSPEPLAAGKMSALTVTEDMLGNYSPDVRMRATVGTDAGVSDPYAIYLQPTNLTVPIRVKIYIKGVNNIRSAVAQLTDVRESVSLWNWEYSDESVAQQFPLGDLVYEEGSPFNGWMTGSLNALGFDVDKPHQLVLKALLVDGKTIVEQRIDVIAREVEEEGGGISLYMEVEAAPIGDVQPEEGFDSGFDASVDDWGEEENSELPI